MTRQIHASEILRKTSVWMVQVFDVGMYSGALYSVAGDIVRRTDRVGPHDLGWLSPIPTCKLQSESVPPAALPLQCLHRPLLLPSTRTTSLHLSTTTTSTSILAVPGTAYES